MVYVKVNAGLCNQIYRFAAAYALAREWHEELIIDPDIDGMSEFTYLLDEFEIPSYKKAVYPARYNVGREYLKLVPELKEKVVIIDESYFEQVGEYLTIPKEKFRAQYPDKDIYLKGIFFKRQMFTKYLPDLQKIFTLKTLSPFVQEFEKRTQGVTAVGVHIRKQGFTVLGDDNGIDFFMAAIVYMRQRHGNARFFIFSDDLGFVKEHLGTADDIFYVDAMNGYRGDIEEFVCLLKCHHYILTRRSTYGRMAEILNPSESKTSVLYGKNTWNDSEERFKFLLPGDVKTFAGLFEKRPITFHTDVTILGERTNREKKRELITIGLDSETVSGENRKSLMFEKAKLYAADGEYGQAVHLCRILKDQYGVDYEEFHEYFGDCLCKYGRMREAIVEYIRAAQKKGIQKEIFKEAVFAPYQRLFEDSVKKHYIVVQFGPYTSSYMSQMQIVGVILASMGNKVSFIFKRDSSEIVEGAQNIAMMKWNRKLDDKWMALMLENGFAVGRFCYGCQCYDYADILEGKADKLRQIAEKYPEEAVVVGREPEMFSGDIPFRKVFVDFSPPFDEAYLKEEVGEENLYKMYETADIVVTGDKEYMGNGQKVIQIDNTLLDSAWNGEKGIPCYEPTVYTEDYLDIALNIALFTI